MKKKICDKCFKEIGEKEDYYKLETFIAGESYKESFIHLRCNEDINKQNAAAMKQLSDVMSFLPGVFSSLGIEPQKIVTIE